jgi:hypothetical protein
MVSYLLFMVDRLMGAVVFVLVESPKTAVDNLEDYSGPVAPALVKRRYNIIYRVNGQDPAYGWYQHRSEA